MLTMFSFVTASAWTPPPYEYETKVAADECHERQRVAQLLELTGGNVRDAKAIIALLLTDASNAPDRALFEKYLDSPEIKGRSLNTLIETCEQLTRSADIYEAQSYVAALRGTYASQEDWQSLATMLVAGKVMLNEIGVKEADLPALQHSANIGTARYLLQDIMRRRPGHTDSLKELRRLITEGAITLEELNISPEEFKHL